MGPIKAADSAPDDRRLATCVRSVHAYTELVAVRVGQQDSAVRVDPDPRRPKGDQPIDLAGQVPVDGEVVALLETTRR